MTNAINKEKGFSSVVVVSVVAVIIIAGLLIAYNKASSEAKNAAATEEANIKLVQTFEDLAFNTKNVDASLEYLTDNIIQHNPSVPTGKEGFKQGVGGYLVKQYPNMKITTKHAYAKGDMVFSHKFGKFDDTNAADPGVAIVDIYRIENGKIAEHWDVIQAIPATSANNNTMF
jgi:predicted SnoaL-like aldol condensation-catalyzing enzyme